MGGVVNFFLLIIKRILGIKRIFPCSFGNKRMRLLTRVYGMSPTLNGSSVLECFECSNMFETCNEKMYDFYPELPHVVVLGRVKYFSDK